MISFIKDKEEKERISKEVLYKLPEWFGLPDSTKEYINCSKEMPFWADIEQDSIRGFIALKETSAYTIEIYVVGVLKEFHGKNIGSKLFDACYEYCKNKGYLYMQVKTVKEGTYREYDKTISFYKRLGFKEFECMPTLWDEWNPCQIFILSLI